MSRFNQYLEASSVKDVIDGIKDHYPDIAKKVSDKTIASIAKKICKEYGIDFEELMENVSKNEFKVFIGELKAAKKSEKE